MSTPSNESRKYLAPTATSPFSHNPAPDISPYAEDKPFDASLEVNFSAAPASYNPEDFSKAVGSVVTPKFTHGKPHKAPYTEGDGTVHVKFNDGSKTA